MNNQSIFVFPAIFAQLNLLKNTGLHNRESTKKTQNNDNIS